MSERVNPPLIPRNRRPPAAPTKLCRMMISDKDLTAIQFMMQHYRCKFEVDAVRLAILDQRNREQSGKKITAAQQQMMARIKNSTSNLLAKVHKFGSDEIQLRSWSGRFSDEVLDAIHGIQKYWGLEHQAEAIRLAIRIQAELLGFKPAEGAW